MNPLIQRKRAGNSGSTGGTGGAFTDVYLSLLGLSSGADFTAGPGVNLIVDTNSARLGTLYFSSGSKFSYDESASRIITAHSIMGEAGAIWEIGRTTQLPGTISMRHIMIGAPNGSEANRQNHPLVAIPQGKTNDGMARGVNWHGDKYFNGTRKALLTTLLAATANAGDSTIRVQGNVKTATTGFDPWKVGERLAVEKTNFYSQSNTEERTITAIAAYNSGTNTTDVTLNAPLSERHFGVTQYPIDAAYGTNGISLTPGTFTPPDADVPIIYDTRARVFNLSSGNITIEGEADYNWTANGFGAQVMNHPGSTYYGRAVRHENVGQRGILKGYGDHDHSLSYSSLRSVVTFDSTGTYLKVNWTGHGIVKQIKTGTITFTNNPYVGPGSGLIQAQLHGVAQADIGTGVAFVMQPGVGSTLPTGITAGTIYFMYDVSTGTDPTTIFIATTPFFGNPGAGGAPMVAWVNSGTGTTNIADLSSAAPYKQGDHGIMFQSTGTLPSGLVPGDINFNTASPSGSRYRVFGPSITADSFLVYPWAGGAPILSAGIGSGIHTGLYSKETGPKYTLSQMQDESFVTHAYRDGCCVVNTANRGFVTHATNYSKRMDCFAYGDGSRGTGAMNFSGEDGSERYNYQARDYAHGGRIPPSQADRLKDFDGPYSGEATPYFGSSGHWITNTNNWFIDLGGYNCEGYGVHNSLGPECYGISALLPIRPNQEPVLRWLRNGGQGNQNRGVSTQSGITDEFGRSDQGTNAQIFGNASINELGFQSNLFEGLWSWKNEQGAYLNVFSGDGPFYKGAWTGDNGGVDWEGSMNNALLDPTSILMVGYSFLDAATAPIANFTSFSTIAPRGGNATYHATLILHHIAYVNLPWVRSYWRRGGQQDYGGGAIMLRDVYTDAIFIQYKYMNGCTFSNSHPGHLTRDYRYSGYPVTMTLANPCVVTSPYLGLPGEFEFDIIDGSPFRFVRTTGAIPAAFSLDVEYFIKNSSTVGTVRTFQLALTSGGASISTAGQTQSGTHSGVPMWRATNQPMRTTYGTSMPDPDGQFVKAFTGASVTNQWVCPYGDSPYYTTGMRNIVAVEPNLGWNGLGFSTSDFFIGFDNITTDQTSSLNSRQVSDPAIGFVVTRKNPSTFATIGVIKNDPFPAGCSLFFQGFVHGALPGIRGSQTCYFIEPGGSYVPATTYSAIRFTAAQDPDVNHLVAIRFAGTPTTVFRTQAGELAPTVVVAGVGMSVTMTQATGADNAAKIAAVAASATGALYHYDATAGYVYVRILPLPLNAGYTTGLLGLRNTDTNKSIDSQWLIIKG